jgi:hypothetical protein
MDFNYIRHRRGYIKILATNFMLVHFGTLETRIELYEIKTHGGGGGFHPTGLHSHYYLQAGMRIIAQRFSGPTVQMLFARQVHCRRESAR